MATPTTSIAALIDSVIGREGGYSNHPADRGGPTRWGVTQQVARAYGYAGDMRALPREKAAAIYEEAYWRDPGFEGVAARYPEVAELLFDIGVNMGTSVAGRFLQRTLNLFNQKGDHYADLTADGRLGRLSLLALDAFRQRRGAEGGDRLWEAVHALRGARYFEITDARPANEAFAYGWFGRMVEMVKARFGR
jgi:lysozyme family protein